jgi:hypothetical protein
VSTDDRAYPLAVSVVDDPRFDFSLLEDVARVLEAHGYPPVRAAADLHQLHLALYRFLYAGSEQ